MRRLLAAPVAALLVCAVNTPASATPPAVDCTDPPAVVAHRGGDELWTENTLNAFHTADVQAGAAIWETDVRFDVKNVPVILHDDTVDRTSPATGAIAELQNSGSVRIATDDGQQIPTEWELLNLAQQDSARVLLELKVMPANTAQWNAFFGRIDITVGRDKVTVTSFDTTVLAAVRAKDPTIRTGWIDEWGDPGVPAITAQGQTFVKYAPAFTKDRYTAWHAAGLELFAWTVDAPVDFPRLVNYPVDGLITDKPLAYATWLKLRCPPPASEGEPQ